MSGMRVSASARVTLTVEVACSGGGWGEGTKIEQVHKQAVDSALGTINQINSTGTASIRIIGEPKVIAVLMETEK